MIEWLLYIALGAALGTMGGLFGIGGGLIAIPALGVLFGLDQQLAQGTALVMVVPNVLLALWRYHQRNRIELRHALPLALCSLLFAWLGSIWAVGIDAQSMRLGFVGEANAYMGWLRGRVSDCCGKPMKLNILYAIDGQQELPETELTHLAGHGGAQPVRMQLLGMGTQENISNDPSVGDPSVDRRVEILFSTM